MLGIKTVTYKSVFWNTGTWRTKMGERDFKFSMLKRCLEIFFLSLIWQKGCEKNERAI